MTGVQSVQDMKAAFLNVLKDAETSNVKQDRESDKCRKEERTALLSRSGTSQSDPQDAPVNTSVVPSTASSHSSLGAELPARKLRPLQPANCRYSVWKGSEHKASEEETTEQKTSEEIGSEETGTDSRQGASDTYRMSTVGSLQLTLTNLAQLEEICRDEQQPTFVEVPFNTARMPAQAFDSVSSDLLGLPNPVQLHKQTTKVSPGNSANSSHSRVESKAFISCKSDDKVRTWELPVDLMSQNSGGASASFLEKERSIRNAVKAMMQGHHLPPDVTLTGPQQNSSSSTAPGAPPPTSSNDVTLPCMPEAHSMAPSVLEQPASQNGSDRPSHAGGNNPVIGPPDDDAKSSCQNADDGAVGGANGVGPTKRVEVTAYFSWQSDIPVFHQDPLTALLRAEIPGQIEPE